MGGDIFKKTLGRKNNVLQAWILDIGGRDHLKPETSGAPKSNMWAQDYQVAIDVQLDIFKRRLGLYRQFEVQLDI